MSAFVALLTAAISDPLTTTLIELLPVKLFWATWISQPDFLELGQVVGELLLLGVEVGALVEADDDLGRVGRAAGEGRRQGRHACVGFAGNGRLD